MQIELGWTNVRVFCRQVAQIGLQLRHPILQIPLPMEVVFHSTKKIYHTLFCCCPLVQTSS